MPKKKSASPAKPRKKTKAIAKSSSASSEKDESALSANEKFVIDEAKGLVFSSENELYDHFKPTIQKLEAVFFKKREADDVAIEQFPDFEECLPLLLEEPFEIWEDSTSFPGNTIYNYIGEFEDEEKPEEEPVFYIAQVYMNKDIPSFVYLHFPTKKESLVDFYRKDTMIFDHTKEGLAPGAAEGDALSEGEELAVGLYSAMLKVRNDKDIAEEDFPDFVSLREKTLDEPDEIWRTNDLQGNILVSFIKEFPDLEVTDHQKEDLFYVVITVEEESTQTQALLFSFPTVDKGLVDRYRHGENLQAEEIVRQSNH